MWLPRASCRLLQSSFVRGMDSAVGIRACSVATDEAIRPGVAFMFPGQGSQRVGMSKDLCESFAAARLVMEEVDEALQQRLSRMMMEGDQDDLTQTRNAQPAILAHSVAVFRVLQAEGLLPDNVTGFLGHSVGHYSALVAAGSMHLSDAARLLRVRGEAMQRCSPEEPLMTAWLFTREDRVDDLLQELRDSGELGDGGVAEVANVNAKGQVVVSGHHAAVTHATDVAKERRIARRAKNLDVSAPFHCSLMAPAAQAVKDAITDVTLTPPVAPVVSNVTASPVGEDAASSGDWAGVAKRDLVTQVVHRVRWFDSLTWMQSQCAPAMFLELGPGAVLGGLVRASLGSDARTTSVGETDGVRDWSSTVKSLE